MISPIYSIGLGLIEIGIKLKSFIDPSLRPWRNKRKLDFIINNLGDQLKVTKHIWVHCASLGEYHMIRPLLSQLKEQHQSNVTIFISFYSPSGYDNVDEVDLYDAKFYLPKDSQANAKALIKAIKPDIFIGVKYEFWWNLLNTLQINKIPIVYMNVSFLSKPGFFNAFHPNYKAIFQKFNKVFIQNHQTKLVLNQAGIFNTEIIGDTRLDNVLNRKSSSAKISFQTDKPVFVWGSIYDYEITLINEVIASSPHIHHIIVPHDIGSKNIEKITNRITFRYEILAGNKIESHKLVNRVGLLFELYRIASYAYIGGGQTGKLHNILEPLAHNIPITFGPKHTKYPEAQEAINMGMATEVKDAKSILEYIDMCKSEKAKLLSSDFINKKAGASSRVVEYLNEQLSL